MADKAAYGLIAVKYDSTVYPAGNARVNLGCEQILDGSGASVFPTIAATLRAHPIVSISTPAIATWLGAFGQMFEIESAKTLVLYFAKRQTGTTWASGSTVKTITVNEGAVYLRRISARQGSVASADFDIYATFDGTNLPLVETTASAPTDAILDELFTLGPAKISSLLETMSWTWDTGYDIKFDGYSGHPYAYIAAVRAANPRVTIEFEDLTKLTTSTTIGTEVSNLTLFLQKTSATIARVAAATEQHIGILFAKSHIIPNDLNGAFRGDADLTITAAPRYDGSNAVAVIDTTMAIA